MVVEDTSHQRLQSARRPNSTSQWESNLAAESLARHEVDYSAPDTSCCSRSADQRRGIECDPATRKSHNPPRLGKCTARSNCSGRNFRSLRREFSHSRSRVAASYWQRPGHATLLPMPYLFRSRPKKNSLVGGQFVTAMHTARQCEERLRAPDVAVKLIACFITALLKERDFEIGCSRLKVCSVRSASARDTFRIDWSKGVIGRRTGSNGTSCSAAASWRSANAATSPIRLIVWGVRTAWIAKDRPARRRFTTLHKTCEG